MSDSYPIIQESLTDTQKEFMGCVEMHLDPPEHMDPTYRVEAVFRYGEPAPDLPGDGIRFTVSVDEDDPDISERNHLIEFVMLDAPGVARPVGYVKHCMKRIESSQGTFFYTESRFKVSAPGFPHRTTREAEVEEEVMQCLERVRVLDRGRKLIEIDP